MPPEMHVWNGERAQLGQWRDLEGVGVIAVRPGDLPPSPAFVHHCCSSLCDAGFRMVVTPALSPAEVGPYVQAGFHEREQLHVLVCDISGLPQRHRPVSPPAGIEYRRERVADLPATLAVDHAAFDDFWSFDSDALAEACNATPQSRFRVAAAGSNTVLGDRGFAPTDVVGYCITGRSRYQGFLQRLAVTPAAQGLGIGREFVWDAMRWLARRRARSCVVNTQESNVRARVLYESCGFSIAPAGLYVLERELVAHRDAVV
ncbi:MAG: GNAT family N-acetyltransferase [Acidimicrobiia bacterium]